MRNGVYPQFLIVLSSISFILVGLAIVRQDVQIHKSPPYLQIMSSSTTASGRATLPRPLRESSETQALLHRCHRENRRGHVRVDSRWWSVSYMPRFRSLYWNRPPRKCKGIIQKVHVFELIGHSSWTPMLIKKQIYSSGARFETDEVKQDNLFGNLCHDLRKISNSQNDRTLRSSRPRVVVVQESNERYRPSCSS